MNIEAMRQALEALEKLWNIIDDIDTYGDMAKADEKLYRSLVERRQRTRFEETGISTDGYTLNGGAITALRQAIEQAEQQEPVAYVTDNYSRDGVNDEISVFLPVGTTIYTSPPPCQPLTDEIKDAFYEGFTSVETYNDTNLVDVDDAWKKYKAAHGIKG